MNQLQARHRGRFEQLVAVMQSIKQRPDIAATRHTVFTNISCNVLFPMFVLLEQRGLIVRDVRGTVGHWKYFKLTEKGSGWLRTATQCMMEVTE
jgi:predicted transcriptional regulator